MSYDHAEVHGNSKSDKAYAYHCSLTICRCGKDPRRLRELWLNLRNERLRKKDVLDDYVLHDMNNGTPNQFVS
jgi:hypothetical protein